MKVIIVAKTVMGRAFCIGAMALEDGRSLRLVARDGIPGFAQSSCPYNVGEIWDVEVVVVGSVPPHMEDAQVLHGAREGIHPNPRAFILEHEAPWEGPPDTAFDGRLEVEGSKGFHRRGGAVPARSTGFWKPGADLVQAGADYRYEGASSIKYVKYVGFQPMAPRIPKGSLVRLSLSRFNSKVFDGTRAYLQLSGWY